MKERVVDTTTSRGLISRLRELIAALDRRTLRPERKGTQIVAESAELREQARKRIAELETRKLSIELGELCARPSLRLRPAR
jgi:hypothetical protein